MTRRILFALEIRKEAKLHFQRQIKTAHTSYGVPHEPIMIFDETPLSYISVGRQICHNLSANSAACHLSPLAWIPEGSLLRDSTDFDHQ